MFGVWRRAERVRHPPRARVRAAEPDTAIVVGYEDQAQNDWQSLFRLVQGHIEGGPETYYEPDGNVYAVAVGTSFYESCFAPESIDLSFSATAFHWLTSCPADIPDALHSACTADPATKKAFGERARKDWTHILSKRAAELKPGGQLVVANFATDEAGSFLGRTPGKQCMHSNFSDLWLKVAGADVHAQTNFPNEYRALDACRAAFENPFVGLALRSIETDVVPCPYREEWVSGPQTDARGARADEYHARHQRRGIAHHGGVPVSDRVVRARAEERETQRSKTTNDFEFAADGEAEQADVRGAERELGSETRGIVLGIRRVQGERAHRREHHHGEGARGGAAGVGRRDG